MRYSPVVKLALRGVKGDFSAQKLGGIGRHPLRVAGGQKQPIRARAEHFRATRQVIRQAFRNQVGLGIDGDFFAQGRLKLFFHQRIVRTPKDRRVWFWHFSQQCVHMTAHKGLCQDQIAIFDGINDPATGLRIDR